MDTIVVGATPRCLDLTLRVVITPHGPMHALCEVNGRHVGKITIETRIVEVAFMELEGKDYVKKRENREVTRAFFRCGRDGFKRGLITDLAPGSTIADLEHRFRAFAPAAIQAFLGFYNDQPSRSGK